MQLLAWISNLSTSNKHISQLPLAFFFIFENVLTRLFCSLNRKEKGSEKLYRIFLHTMRFESWFDYERIFSSSWFPQRTSLTSPTKFLLLNYVWAWRHKWATTWDDFSSNCAQRIQFLLMRWNLFIFLYVPVAMWHFFILIFALNIYKAFLSSIDSATTSSSD